MRNHIIKTLLGMLFNLAGAYLLFYPQNYPFYIQKIVGVIGLLFSYWIFYLYAKDEKEVKQ